MQSFIKAWCSMFYRVNIVDRQYEDNYICNFTCLLQFYSFIASPTIFGEKLSLRQISVVAIISKMLKVLMSCLWEAVFQFIGLENIFQIDRNFPNTGQKSKNFSTNIRIQTKNVTLELNVFLTCSWRFIHQTNRNLNWKQ